MLFMGPVRSLNHGRRTPVRCIRLFSTCLWTTRAEANRLMHAGDMGEGDSNHGLIPTIA